LILTVHFAKLERGAGVQRAVVCVIVHLAAVCVPQNTLICKVFTVVVEHIVPPSAHARKATLNCVLWGQPPTVTHYHNGGFLIDVLERVQRVDLHFGSIFTFQPIFRPKMDDSTTTNVNAVVVQASHSKRAFND
jgi:hypothetical protein